MTAALTRGYVDTAQGARTVLFLDAHVHIHRPDRVADVLEHALTNFKNAARAAGQGGPVTGVLMLAEIGPDPCFDHCARMVSDAATRLTTAGGWSWQRTQENISLIANRGADRLVLVAGCQVVTAEGLEVLVLGADKRVRDRLPVEETLAQARRRGAVCVLPWGVGKWLFGRGRRVSELIEAAERDALFLGDVSARLAFWPGPRQFAHAHRRGLRILRGTDPLPFPWEADRVGTFGFWMEALFDWQRPAKAVIAALRDSATILHSFGRLERPGRFLKNQIGMQLLKWRARQSRA